MASAFRSENVVWEQQAGYIERRQLFLRSYHFSRKQSPRERVRCSLVRVRRLVWVRLRAARRLPRLLWARLRSACWPSAGHRRCRFTASPPSSPTDPAAAPTTAPRRRYMAGKVNNYQ